MPFTAATEYSGTFHKVFTAISSATTDGSGANSLTIAHGFGASVGIANATDATHNLQVTLEPILPQGLISGWYVVVKDGTNIVLSKSVNVAGSGDNAAQVRVHALVLHSIQQ